MKQRVAPGRKLLIQTARMIALLSLLLVGCGGGDGGNGTSTGGGTTDGGSTDGGASDGGSTGSNTGGGTGPSGDDVQDTLDNLRVDTDDTPRADASGEALPVDYAPLGSKATLLTRSELFLASLPRTSTSDTVSLLKYVPDTAGSGQMTDLAPSLDTSWQQAAVHAATGGDIDGDGFDEIVVAWQDASTMAIRLKVFDDTAQGYLESPESTLLTADPSWLSMITGDFNGDGTDQIAIAIVDDGAQEINLYFLSGSTSTSFAVSGSPITWNAQESPSRLGIELATGRLDRDSGEELVVVINETGGSGTNQSPGRGRSDYYIFDDQNNAFTQRNSARIQGIAGNASYLGVTGTVALGDIDGDSIDEIVIAALDRFAVRCEDVTSLQIAIDDLDAGLATLDTILGVADINNCEQSGNNGHTEHLWAGILDIDGDQYQEIHVNGVIYDDFVQTSGSWTQIAEIDTRYIFRGSGNNDRAQTRRDNTMMAVGDVTADGRDDIIIYSPKRVKVGRQTQGNVSFDITDSAITVWSIEEFKDMLDVSHIEILESFADENENRAVVLLPVNVDNDSTILQSVENSHELVFSEPIVHAALAAPPCWNSGVQATDECRTAWGQGSSIGADASVSHTISGKYHTGVNATVALPVIGDVGVEVEKTVGVSLTAEASLGYELSRTHTYTTGSMEDTVIATVIPYDQYSYRILAHPVYPDLVGEEMVISLPRRPRTIQIEREFYNNSIVGDGVRVDSSVFAHTIGNPRSYPGRNQITGFGSNSFGPFDVGLSSGSQTAEISETISAGLSASVSVSYETTVKATSGKAMAGFSVGSETTATLGVSTGSSVVFTGTVGDLSPSQAANADLEYSFGISAYQQSTGQQDRPFQVINYWVE